MLVEKHGLQGILACLVSSLGVPGLSTHTLTLLAGEGCSDPRG